MPIVPFNQNNWSLCRFSNVGLHSSQCIAAKTANFHPPRQAPAPPDAEGVFCSKDNGKSTCSDLNGSLVCICPDCGVWENYGLDGQWFCIDGPAT